MTQIKAILFDFDGTLADTTNGIVTTMKETFREMNLPIPAHGDMVATIGIPLKKALQELNNLTDEEANTATETYELLFPHFEAKLVDIFPGVAETLKQIADRGIRMAIVTSRGADSLQLIMSRRGIADFFETRITNSDGLAAKPAPDMVNALLQRMQLSKDDVLVVGDTTFDIEMGNSAGCKTVAVTYGNHSEEKLKAVNPTYIIHDFSELVKLV